MKKFRHYYTVLNRIKRSRGFGIHSPFAFNFILRVLRERNHYYAYTAIKRRRKRAYSLSGSLPEGHPRVISSRNAKLLFRIACYFTPEHILQIGATYGVSTSAILDVSSASRVTLCPCGNPYADIFAAITEEYASRITTFNDPAKSIDYYLTMNEDNRPFVLINHFPPECLSTIKDLLTLALDREGVVIIRNLAINAATAKLWNEYRPSMTSGMSFCNDYTVVIVGLRHLPLQHHNIIF